MSESKKPDRLLTDTLVAERYGIHRVTVWKWARASLIPKPVVGPGGRPRWRESEIDQDIASREHMQLKELAS